jgi:hypothetical protein
VLAAPENLFLSNFRITGDGRLVFEAGRSGPLLVRPRGIFTVPMDGSSEPVQILGARGDPWPLKHEVSLKGDVVFVGYARGFQLFSLPIEGGAPALQLNPPLVAGGGITDANFINARAFMFSSDAAWLLYNADQEQNNVRELFAVAPDGSSPARRVNGPLPPGGNVISYTIAPDSWRVLYSVWTSTSREVFTSVIADCATEAIERHARRTPARTLQKCDTTLVEDPRRMDRNEDGMPGNPFRR